MSFDIRDTPDFIRLMGEARREACSELLEHLWQHGFLSREDAMHFDKTYGDGTVGNRPWKGTK